jgi:hypothetical protein
MPLLGPRIQYLRGTFLAGETSALVHGPCHQRDKGGRELTDIFATFRQAAKPPPSQGDHLGDSFFLLVGLQPAKEDAAVLFQAGEQFQKAGVQLGVGRWGRIRRGCAHQDSLL